MAIENHMDVFRRLANVRTGELNVNMRTGEAHGPKKSKGSSRKIGRTARKAASSRVYAAELRQILGS